MTSITASSSTAVVARASLVRSPSKVGVSSSSSPVLGLPKLSKPARVTCSMEKKQEKSSITTMGGITSSLTMVAVSMMSSPAAMALVDDRMSTEGTGLPFGLSNNLLGWILFGVFGFIWTFYIIYTAGLEEDEESGLSL